MRCSKFAGAAQHFLLLLQKKTLAKEKEPEGISISPQTPLNRPEKPLRFFWTFPAIAENPMRIRTTLWTFSAGYFAAVIQTQLLTNPLFRIRRRAAETRRVSLEWNAKPKHWCLPEFRRRKHPTVTQRPFSPPSFPARRKRRGRRRRVRNDHNGTNPCKQGFLSSVLVSSFPNRKLNLRFGFFPANLRQPLSLGFAEPASLPLLSLRDISP